MDIVRQSLAITFVFALLWTALWWLRKKGAVLGGPRKARGERGVLESRGKLALSQQHSIHLVRIGQRELVLGLHPAGVSLLAELAVAPEGEK